MSTRDVVAMKLWIPEYLNDDGSSGEPAQPWEIVHVQLHSACVYEQAVGWFPLRFGIGSGR